MQHYDLPIGRGRSRSFSATRGAIGSPVGGDQGQVAVPNDSQRVPQRTSTTKSLPPRPPRQPFRRAPQTDPNQMPPSEAHEKLVNQQMPHGTEGVPIELIGNFYRILTLEMLVHEYSVKIEKIRMLRKNSDGSEEPAMLLDDLPEARKVAQERFIKKFADLIMKEFMKKFDSVFCNVPNVYNGYNNLITTQMLKFAPERDDFSGEICVEIDGRISLFNVILKRIDSVSLTEVIDFYQKKSSQPISEHVISVYEIIFRNVIGKSYTTHQRKFFDLDQAQHSYKAKICDFVPGFINSVRMTEFGLALNVHLKTACTISKSYTKLIDLICDILNVGQYQLQRLNKRQLFEVNKIIRHLKIFTLHSKSKVTYTIGCLLDKTPKEIKMNQGSGPVPIECYFKEKYDMKLELLPMVKVAGRGDIHLPLELCYLHKSQFLRKEKLTKNMEQELLTKATHQPNNYFHKVADIVNTIKETDTDDLLNQFGADLNPNAARFQGRILPMPKTICSRNIEPFFKPGDSNIRWLVCCFEQGDLNTQDLGSFVNQLIARAKYFQLELPKPQRIEFVQPNSLDHIEGYLNELFNKIDLIFVGIPANPTFPLQNKDIYNRVKQCCDQQLGIMSQCFDAEKLRNPPRGYFDTLLLKVNGKIGGQNSALHPISLNSLPVNTKRTMLVGIDVAHGSQTERVLSSVAAAVGSYNDTFSRYNATIRVQRKERDEMVKQLDQMMVELLNQYYERNSHYPENLIVFRDGVSEGQFNKIQTIEIPLIRQAIKQTIGRTIKLTVVVVQKRHNSRFALTQQDMSGRRPTWNVPSGTVVDRSIVDCNLKVFYLNSHFSPLGTSRPTKYIVIEDDLNLLADQMQKLCYYSCFNCVRTRNIIAIPVPTRYADLAAYRAKLHIEAQRTQDDSLSQSSARTQGQLDPVVEAQIIADLNNLTVVDGLLRSRLYYS